MSEEIIKVLDALAAKFGLAVDWTSANVIPYIQQLCGKYVSYEVATSVVDIVIGIIFVILSILCFKKAIYFSNKKDEDYTYEPACIICFIICGIAFIIGIPTILKQIFDIVTCYTFPEKIIFDELKMLLQNAS